MKYIVPKQSVRFEAEIAALDTGFILRPLDGKAVSAFHDLFNGYGCLTSRDDDRWCCRHPQRLGCSRWNADHHKNWASYRSTFYDRYDCGATRSNDCDWCCRRCRRRVPTNGRRSLTTYRTWYPELLAGSLFVLLQRSRLAADHCLSGLHLCR